MMIMFPENHIKTGATGWCVGFIEPAPQPPNDNREPFWPIYRAVYTFDHKITAARMLAWLNGGAPLRMPADAIDIPPEKIT